MSITNTSELSLVDGFLQQHNCSISDIHPQRSFHILYMIFLHSLPIVQYDIYQIKCLKIIDKSIKTLGVNKNGRNVKE